LLSTSTVCNGLPAKTGSSVCFQVLEDLDVGHIPMISVWNKVDVCADPEMVQTVADKRDNTVCVSAQTGQGLPELMNLVERKVQESMMPVDVLVPYTQVTFQHNLPNQIVASVSSWVTKMSHLCCALFDTVLAITSHNSCCCVG